MSRPPSGDSLPLSSSSPPGDRASGGTVPGGAHRPDLSTSAEGSLATVEFMTEDMFDFNASGPIRKTTLLPPAASVSMKSPTSSHSRVLPPKPSMSSSSLLTPSPLNPSMITPSPVYSSVSPLASPLGGDKLRSRARSRSITTTSSPSASPAGSVSVTPLMTPKKPVSVHRGEEKSKKPSYDTMEIKEEDVELKPSRKSKPHRSSSAGDDDGNKAAAARAVAAVAASSIAAQAAASSAAAARLAAAQAASASKLALSFRSSGESIAMSSGPASASVSPATPGSPSSGFIEKKVPDGDKLGTNIEEYVKKKAGFEDTGFARQLLHTFGSVQKQMDAGINLIHRVKTFSEQYFELHSAFGENLKRLVDQERSLANAAAMKGEQDRMEGCWSAWTQLLDSVESTGIGHRMLASTGKLEVCSALDALELVSAERMTEIVKGREEITRGIKMLRDHVEKVKSKCEKVLSEADLLPEDSKIVDRSESHASLSRASTLLFLQKKEKKRKLDQERKLLAKAYTACNAYDEAIINSNQFLRTYSTRDLPLVLSHIQSVEEMRIYNLKSSLSRLASIMTNMGSEYLAQSQACQPTIAMIDVYKEISAFIETCKEEPPDLAFSPITYSAPVSLEMIKKMMAEVDAKLKVDVGRKMQFFGVSLKDIMKQQHEIFPLLPIPILQIALQNCIRDSGGLVAEGIFRISGETSEVLALHERLEQGNFMMKEVNCHAAASLLKKWLRELESPLIDGTHYDDALKMCVEGKLKAPDMMNFLEQLPELNRAVLRELLILLGEICSPENVKITKMNVTNLAICFAPSIMNASKLDPAERMKNSRHETLFVEKLVAELPPLFDGRLEVNVEKLFAERAFENEMKKLSKT